MSKIFTKILKERFISCAEENNGGKEEQAGYRMNYSTIDQIFNLQFLVQEYMWKSKGRFYVLMVDFSKGFDRPTVPHTLLLYKLMDVGVYGRLNVLRNMYKGLKSCVKTPKGSTDFFIVLGPWVGCMLSPMLFFLHKLFDMLNEERCIGVYINEDVPNIIWSMTKRTSSAQAKKTLGMLYMYNYKCNVVLLLRGVLCTFLGPPSFF